MLGSGSRDSSVSTIFIGLFLSMGTGDLFQTISGIQGKGDSAQLILQEGIWEMPWQIYPIRQEDLPPKQPAMVGLQSQDAALTIRRLIAQQGFPGTGEVAACPMSGVGLVVLDYRQDTDHHHLDIHPEGEFHPVALLMEVLLAMGAA
jgi:hypothetical protein